MEKVNKIALVTGASSGIGQATALELVKRGYAVAFVARRKEKLNEIVEQVNRQGGKALAVVCDVTDRNSLAQAVRQTQSQLGTISAVVANAGFGVVGTVENLSPEDFARQFETNIYGVIHTVKATLADLKITRGNLAIVGSVNGYVSLPGNSPYAMSKYAVRALAESLYHELKPEGVSVTYVAPGFIVSEIRKIDNRGKLHDRAKDPIPMWIQMPAPLAAKKLVRALLKRKPEVIITFHGKLAVWLQRHFPWLLRTLLTAFSVKARRQP